MRGRPPKPEALKEAQGTKRPGRDRGDAPQPEAAIIPPPDHLTEGAAGEWRRVMPELTTHGLFTRLDVAALEGYCTFYDLAVRAQDELSRKGEKATLILDLPNGFSQADPLVEVIAKCYKMASDFGARFGLDPASRSKLRIQKPKAPEQKNKVAALRERKRA